jgi:antitoxin component of RelBE/YafQ-DinJ toxin-antitoxin module
MIIEKMPKIKRKVFIQAKIDEKIANETKKLIKKYGFKWNDILESCLEVFVAEIKRSEKKL